MDRWKQISQLYHDVLGRDESQRAAFLDAACAGDDALRREVESLITRERSEDDFLARPAVEMAARMMNDDPGASLVGRAIGGYQVLSRLGAGGMGEVYRARDLKLGRDVAIKVLPSFFATDPERLRRFEREARLLASLNHPHIGAIYGLEQTDGFSGLILELVDGPTLSDRLAGGAVPFEEGLKIGQQIAEALEAAHEKGIIHRDLKPANIKLTRDGDVKVLDFGLAKAFAADESGQDSPDMPTVTATELRPGMIVGTPAYMSPEQARGQAIDKRTDIWAFGCVLFEMLTGRVAFPGDTISDTIAAILERDPVWTALPASTPAAVRRLLAQCLDKDPRRRLRDIGQARIELDDAIREPHARDTRSAPPVPTPLSRRLAPAAGLALLLLAGGVGVVYSLNPSVPVTSPSEYTQLPNSARPVIVLMDSPLPGRVYDARTLAAGGTNADDVSDALRGLDVVTHKENTSPMWHREEQVRGENPDLIISHLSCLYDVRLAKADEETAQQLFDAAVKRLTLFFGYLGVTNPRARFLVYSRSFDTKEMEEAWLADVIARFPQLRGRLFVMLVPGGESATFRDPATAELLRTRVREILALP